MNPYITCHVEGDPKPQPRPKVNTHTRSVYYEGKGYKAWRALLTEQFSLLLRSVKGFPEPARVSVFINVRIARPASHFKKSGEIRPASGRNLPPGDVDNHAKVILDAAQDAGIFADDRQVRFLSVDCDWTGPNELPGARVRVTEITWREKGQKKNARL